MVCRCSKTSNTVLCPPILILITVNKRTAGCCLQTLTSWFQLTPRVFICIEIIRKFTVGMVNGQTTRSTINDGLWIDQERKGCNVGTTHTV